jgi:ABC-type lipoprotein release transport system permease subunit
VTGVIVRLRSDLKARWTLWAGLAVLVGLMGGTVLMALFGASRTDSAYGRFASRERAADALVFLSGNPAFASLHYEQVATLPGVADVAPVSLFEPTGDVLVLVPEDGRYGTSISGARYLSGRPPDPRRADQVAVGFDMADHLHLREGSRLSLTFVTNSGAMSRQTFRVTGIEAAPLEFPPSIGAGSNNNFVVHATPAFSKGPGSRLAQYSAAAVRLSAGANTEPRFLQLARTLGGHRPVSIYVLADQAANVKHFIHFQAVALLLLAVIVALVGIVIFGQLLTRQAYKESGEWPALVALGMTRMELWAVGMGRALFTATVAAGVAGVVALLTSPLFPIGLARVAEPNPGMAFNMPVVLGGMGAVLLMVLLLSGLADVRVAGRVARAPASGRGIAPGGPPASPGWLSVFGARPAMLTGVRMAFSRLGSRNGPPVAGALVAIVAGVAAIVVSFGFSASAHRLLSSPSLYGVTADAIVQCSCDVRTAREAVLTDPQISDVAIGQSGIPLEINGISADADAMEPVRGSIRTVVLTGRLPISPDEILLGRTTLSKAHARLGGLVRVDIAGVSSRSIVARVVGLGVVSPSDDAGRLGEGAVLTASSLSHLVPPGVVAPPPNAIAVRFVPSTPKDQALEGLRVRMSRVNGRMTVEQPAEPTYVADFGHVQDLPFLLDALLAVLAAAAIGHLIVTSVRGHRAELAVLRSMGLLPRQVFAAVAWEASALALVAVAAGVPLGMAAGRWVWRLFADQLGVASQPVVPVGAALLLIPATLVTANLVAVWPALGAARTRPASVLRGE